MRYFLVIGAAVLVAASPAPQAFDVNALDGLPVTPVQGPPVGIGPAQVDAYDQPEAQVAAAAAASVPAAANLVKRGYIAKPAMTPAPSPMVTAAPTANPSSTNMAPSSCTPVDWVNTYAFTADAACATQIEVGTYCGFINPDDPCAAQPNAYAPLTTPDTVDAFKSNPVYGNLAKSAKAPSSYEQAFVNFNGAIEGSGYLAYKELTSYDVNACSAYCDATSTCTGFNIFIERAPKWNPNQCSCSSPDSVARFKCSIFGQDITKTAATNVGQNQGSFEVVIVGSNGYNKKAYTPPTPPSCSKPQSCGTKLHNQAQYCMGTKTFQGPFDPSLCAAYAQSQNALNKKVGIVGSILAIFGMNKGGCVQFQAAYLEKKGKGFGTHCRLFTKKFTPLQANLDINAGNSAWGCQKSFTFDLDVNAKFSLGGLFSKKSKRDE
ncbi:hypothetical protein J1614_011185 [Plenodomus biglobosus]|nr:hypothetical protein J1614_011185 [Plenodomus biglobosus]